MINSGSGSQACVCGFLPACPLTLVISERKLSCLWGTYYHSTHNRPLAKLGNYTTFDFLFRGIFMGWLVLCAIQILSIKPNRMLLPRRRLPPALPLHTCLPIYLPACLSILSAGYLGRKKFRKIKKKKGGERVTQPRSWRTLPRTAAGTCPRLPAHARQASRSNSPGHRTIQGGGKRGAGI